LTTRRNAIRLLCASAAAAGLHGGGAGVAMAAVTETGAAARTDPAKADGGPWQVVTTAQGGSGRFVAQALAAPRAATQPPETDTAVFVDTGHRYQEVFGFGGAVTDSVAETYAKLTPAAQRAFMTAYFDPREGIGYNVLRTTIHSSDFSSASYTYVRDGDRALDSFSIAPDLKYRVPMLRQALAEAAGNGTKMRVFASPWSAPAWMKTNGSMLNGGSLLPEYRDAWSQYIVKFVQAYEKAGIPLWGLSVQNEPMAKQTWESMIFTAEEETRFLGDYLGPALKKAGLGGKKIIAWDHNRDLLPQRAAALMADPKAKPYVWGIGFHWYETWTGGEPMHRNVAAVHEAWPDVNLLLTESTVEKFDPAKLQSWSNAERYGSEVIADLNAGAVGWIDWNMLLDSRGGPNHVGNFCFAPVHATDDGQLVFTPSFAYLGHFARYIRPGARRVNAATSRSTLSATAFRNADGRLAVVVLNKTDQAQRYRLVIDRVEVPVDIPAHAIQTVLR
jgi:glucosylceramidase